MIGSLVSCSTSFHRCFPIQLIMLPLIFAPPACDPEINWGLPSQRMLQSLQCVSEEALSAERQLPEKCGVCGVSRCIRMWSFLSDDNSHLIGQLTWWAELQRKRWSYCTLSASSSLAKRFFCCFFLLYFSSLFRFQVHPWEYPCACSIAATCIGKFSSSILHPSLSRISLWRTRGRVRGAWVFLCLSILANHLWLLAQWIPASAFSNASSAASSSSWENF